MADVVGSGFSPFYDDIVPCLLEAAIYGLERDSAGNVLATGTTVHKIVALQGAAIEAATIIGEAIGNEEKLLSDSEKILKLI